MDQPTRTNLLVFGMAILLLIGISSLLVGVFQGSWLRVVVGLAALVGAGVFVQLFRRNSS